ncbi:MAG: OsmC family protein [Chlorobiaceae bacterium]|nr:OsmC family protein [Chlorobiaceae bacterium]
MHATVTFRSRMPLSGIDGKGHETLFDTSPEFSGTGSAASPMDTVLEALGACSMMDILSILKKMKREPVLLETRLDAERADDHPKVFTSIHVIYCLESPGCRQEELDKAVRLSMEKYCSVAAMLKAGGCSISWSTQLV